MLKSCTLLALLCCCSLAAQSQEWFLSVPQRAVFSIAANPLNPKSMIAGNYSRGFLSSGDGGSTWLELSVGDIGGSSQISALVFHPRDTSIIFAGGIGFTGIDRSTDGGMSWENVLSDLSGARFEIASSGSITFHPDRPDTVYLIRSTPPNVYRSIDGGQTWDLRGTIPDLDASARMRGISVCPIADSSNVLLAVGRRASVHRSSDGGKTWVSMKYNLGTHPFADGSQIRWSPTVRGRVYATSLVGNIGNGGLHYSDDYGITWQLMKFKDTSLNALEVYPTNNGDEIFVGGANIGTGGSAYKGDSVIYRSADGGNTWQDLSDVPWLENELGEVVANVWGFAKIQVDGPAEIFVATEVGAYRSSAVTSIRNNTIASPTLRLSQRGSSLLFTLDSEETAEVVVCSIEGRELTRRVVVGQGQHVIDLSEWSAGAYIASAYSTTSKTATLIIR